MKMKFPLYVCLSVILAFSLILAGCTKKDTASVAQSASPGAAASAAPNKGAEPAVPTIPASEVKFGHEPYGDHTQTIIALKQGWFDEVGIKFGPGEGKVVSGENAISVFASGEVDVISGSIPLFLGASKKLPGFKYFFHADMFQGYAIMAQSNKGYKSAQEFKKEGLSNDEAIKKAVEQMKGKKFGYPAETAIKGFIDLSVKQGGMTLKDVQSVVAEDAKTSAMMIGGEVEFQVGGVPSRLTLESKGFKPILTSGDLASSAKPSADSEELRAVFHDGWGATDKWIEKNYDTALRMASVGWRINQFINDKQDEALAIHLPFLNKVSGTSIEPEVAKVIYNSLDPFVTFDGQNNWYNNDNDPLNVKYVVGSHIKSFEENKLFKPGEFTVDNFSIAGKVYNEMLTHKKTADSQIKEAEGLVKDNTPKAKEFLDKAKKLHAGFDYLDSNRFSKAAVEWAKYESSK